MTPENAYCSDCAWPFECAAQESCVRRDRGEIRSVYLEDAPASFDPGLRRDRPPQDEGARESSPEHASCEARSADTGADPISSRTDHPVAQEAPCGAIGGHSAVSSLDLTGASSRRTGAFSGGSHD